MLSTFEKREDTRVVIVFMGYGEFEESIKLLSINHKNIFFHPAVAPSIVLEYTTSADFGIHMIQNSCLNHYYCMPNKLFEYTMAGLPVIVSDMKEMRGFVEKYDMGIVVEEENSEAISNAIDKILTLDINELKVNARKFAEENAWEIQEKKMIEVYKGLIHDRK